MNVKNIYEKKDNILILHGILKFGALECSEINISRRIENIMTKDTIIHCVSIKENEKSILFSLIGLIIKGGEILHATDDDNGSYTQAHYNEMKWDDSYLEFIINPNPFPIGCQEKYNDIIVKNASIIGFYVKELIDSDWEEVRGVCEKFHLPIYKINSLVDSPQSYKNLNILNEGYKFESGNWYKSEKKYKSSGISLNFKEIIN